MEVLCSGSLIVSIQSHPHSRHGRHRLKAAVETALELGTTGADAVRVIIEAWQEVPVGLFSLDGRPQLKLVRVDQTGVAAYQSLLTHSAVTEVSP